MKVLYAFLIAALCISGSLLTKLQCTLKGGKTPKSWLDMVSPCTIMLEVQLRNETAAAMTYLAMGAHFARDTVNRPGFSKFFFTSANEEREHAIKIIEYLLMRGQLTSNRTLLEFPLKPLQEEWENGLDALTNALELEANITRRIHSINRKCEKVSTRFTDYHVVDYLTEEFLDEQYKGERDLAGKISTLSKMNAMHGSLGEFLFDKKLLNGEV
ncbi:unnamed protein product [Xylocopa violacea]|uniref:Ferritin n=1 Tax=Xylocopa violacea TaxID=135666 RepID=A0ABP1P5V0_XYLVO